MSFNLPPGCSVRDIDINAGEYDKECISCNQIFRAYMLNDNCMCTRCLKEQHEENEESTNSNTTSH